MLLSDFANLISKKRNELMGLATIMIVLYHIRIPTGEYLFDSFRDTLDVGVDIFLLLSGMGCAVSLYKNDKKKYLINRFSRILPEYILVFSVWYTYIASLYPTIIKKLYSFAISITTLNFWMLEDLTVWFVPAIIVLYLLALLLNSLKINGWLALLIFSIIAIMGMYCSWGTIMILVERVPIFLFGYSLANYLTKEGVFQGSKKRYTWIIVVILCLCYVGVLSINNRHISYFFYFFIAIGICHVFSIIKFPNWIINALKRTGGVSFEIYLLFECIIKTVEMIVGSMKTQSIYVAVLYNMVAVIITIIIAIPLKRIGEKVGKQIKILLF